MSRPGTNFTNYRGEFADAPIEIILTTYRELHPHLWPAESLSIRIGIDFDRDVEAETKE